MARVLTLSLSSVGCPKDVPAISPLAFLVIAEALTRLIQNDPNIKGIEINGEHIKISQFADRCRSAQRPKERRARQRATAPC
eukprot:scaffold2423_cov113-Isochrysis_galbana.AAC.13